MTLGR